MISKRKLVSRKISRKRKNDKKRTSKCMKGGANTTHRVKRPFFQRFRISPFGMVVFKKYISIKTPLKPDDILNEFANLVNENTLTPEMVEPLASDDNTTNAINVFKDGNYLYEVPNSVENYKNAYKVPPGYEVLSHSKAEYEVPSHSKAEYEVPSHSKAEYEVPSHSKAEYEVPSQSKAEYEVPSQNIYYLENTKKEHIYASIGKYSNRSLPAPPPSLRKLNKVQATALILASRTTNQTPPFLSKRSYTLKKSKPHQGSVKIIKPSNTNNEGNESSNNNSNPEYTNSGAPNQENNYNPQTYSKWKNYLLKNKMKELKLLENTESFSRPSSSGYYTANSRPISNYTSNSNHNRRSSHNSYKSSHSNA